MRKYNFYPGPSTLPQQVLETMRDEMLEYRQAGASFIELSHRSNEVIACHEHIVALLRELLGVGDEYHVLLLHGGAIGQYAAIPQNLAAGRAAAIAVTGHWSKLARAEMAKYCDLHVCADSYPDCVAIPDPAGWDLPRDARFVLYVDNETVHGVEFAGLPAVGGVPLAIDQSSNILSRSLDMTGVGVVFACLQKNLGPSGLAVVIVRDDLCDAVSAQVPKIWDYRLQAKSQSMVNTAATFQLRMLELMLEWTVAQGGVGHFEQANRAKADRLYDFIDASSYYANPVAKACRSRMNVPFTLARDEDNELFVQQAEQAGLIGLKGHRAVGGLRASIYNSMPSAGVDALLAFMDDFERRQR